MILELILDISEYLPTVAVCAFALTCRPYYHALRPRLLELRSRHRSYCGREEFLQLLERDLPGLYYCHACLRFHRVQKHRGSCGISEECPYRDLSDFRHRRPFDISGHLRFQEARLLMNRHLYGPSHGFALQKSTQHTWQTPQIQGGHIRRHFTRALRILDDELYLLTTCTVKHSSGDIAQLRRSFECSKLFRLCSHVWVQRRPPYHVLGPSIRQMLKGPPKSSRTVTTSCPDCLLL